LALAANQQSAHCKEPDLIFYRLKIRLLSHTAEFDQRKHEEFNLWHDTQDQKFDNPEDSDKHSPPKLRSIWRSEITDQDSTDKIRSVFLNTACNCAKSKKPKLIYGIMEKQFRTITRKLPRKSVSPVMLDADARMRLDNVVFRLGFAITRAQARQLVSHGFFNVNGKKVNIPSYQ
jgi:hypothetical protein